MYAWRVGNVPVATGTPVEIWVKAFPTFDFNGAGGVMIVVSCARSADRPSGIEHMDAWWLSEVKSGNAVHLTKPSRALWDHVDPALPLECQTITELSTSLCHQSLVGALSAVTEGAVTLTSSCKYDGSSLIVLPEKMAL